MVVEAKVTRENRRDVEQLQELLRNVDNLKAPGKKKLVRLQVRLQREGVIVPYNRNEARAAMVEAYKAFPWWKKAALRFKFHKREALKWLRRQWARLQLWWVTK